MQRANPDQMNNLVGVEYVLLHTQEPILYVVRKQHRHSPTQVIPLADYYIIAGVVYQAPDLGSVVNSRVLSAVYHIQTAFDTVSSAARYFPSKGYWWEFKDQESADISQGPYEALSKHCDLILDADQKPKQKEKKEEPSSAFQRHRVDVLLADLARKFPPKVAAPQPPPEKSVIETESKDQVTVKTENNVKTAAHPPNQAQNSIKPPPEKKQRIS
ncbi:Mediator of RNA polymerase II transcription subunit 6 [Nymphon striatum]|nr:Mediator of RNA polymerase II transcription subunit 6 [Nymphon striatum]